MAAAVILSGTGADRASGLKRVKKRGGVVLVQDPAEAEHDEMPRNAIPTGMADVVLPDAGLPALSQILANGRLTSYPTFP